MAAIGLEKAGNKIAGNLVTPAVWVANYATNGNVPNSADLTIYGSGFISAPVGIVVGFFKAIMDDGVNQKVDEIRIKQDIKYRKYIHPVQKYGNNSPYIVALEIATRGGTVWQGHNAQWVYITDANGKLLIDYEPKGASKVIRPVYPFDVENGKFRICIKTCR